MSASEPTPSVTLLGLGLMGASLGLALHKIGFGSVHAYARREATRDQAMALGVVDAVFDTPEAAVAAADFVVVCTPVKTIPELIAQCRDHFKPGCIVTDVGSTKDWIVQEATRALEGSEACFVGSHPMCGSEQTGLECARADLYQNAPVVVGGGDASALAAVRDLWQRVGARVIELDPRRHDEQVADLSHLPHLGAALLVAAALDRGVSDTQRALCASGFRDTTRVAAGSPLMWRDIVETNPDPIRDSLRRLSNELTRLMEMMENKDYAGVEGYLERCARLRAELIAGDRHE